MPSKAYQAFTANAGDINRLLEIHGNLGGSGPGRRYQLEVLNKSAIVLVTAIWEAYCEDLAAEALAHIVEHAKSGGNLSKYVKRRVAAEVKKDPDELAVWRLSDEGWRTVLRKRFGELTEARNRRLNTPKSDNIDELFALAIGIEKVSISWHWPGMDVEQARLKLDRFVELRGAIAHRGRGSGHCYKAEVDDYFNHVKRLVSKTGGEVNRFVKKITARPLWSKA